MFINFLLVLYCFYELMNSVIEQKANGLLKSLREGDMIFVNEKGLPNFLGRLLQRYEWHHVLLYLGDGKVLEAIPIKGCRVSSLKLDSRYNGLKILRYKGISPAQRRKLVANAVRTFLNKKFSWLQILKTLLAREFWLGRLLRLRFASWKNYKCNPNAVMCSNLITMSYYMAGLLIFDAYPPEYVMPKDYENASRLETIVKIGQA